MSNKKYELTNETIVVSGRVLHRIKALKTFYGVNEGDLGGYVETEDNLLHEGNCWVYDNAQIYDNVRVYYNAQINHDAKVFGYAEVFGDAKIFGHVQIYGCAEVHGNARIHDYAKVFNNAYIFGNAAIFDEARVYGSAVVHDDAELYNNADVHYVASVKGTAKLGKNALILTDHDYLIIGPLGPESSMLTFYKTTDNNTMVYYEDYNGKIEEFRNKYNFENNFYSMQILEAISLGDIWMSRR